MPGTLGGIARTDVICLVSCGMLGLVWFVWFGSVNLCFVWLACLVWWSMLGLVGLLCFGLTLFGWLAYRKMFNIYCIVSDLKTRRERSL